VQENRLPFFVALTADVDPDANVPARGRADAVSPGGDGVARTDACGRGLAAAIEVVEDIGIPCTLFWEARTLRALADESADLIARAAAHRDFEHGAHGLRHEDFAGKDSGLPLGYDETVAIVHEATRIVSELAARPAGFRAPYCRMTPELRRALAEAGYGYDATCTRAPGRSWPLRPYRLPADGAGEGLWELALCRARDRSGRAITGYLWQLFEGRRPPQDYIELAATLAQQHPGGLLQIALHPWHLVVSETGAPLAGGVPLAQERLRAVLCGVRQLGNVEFVTDGGYLTRTTRNSKLET